MTTQVVIFSVMLFGTSGVVLDFGRVYSEHSQMQAFTDQAALAAATEMDNTSGSIDNAIAAVFGTGSGAPISKSALFSSGDGENFNISHLYFVRDLADDDGRQYSLGSDLTGNNLVYAHFADGSSSGDKALADNVARYVVAVADERSVRNSLMQLINATGNSQIQENNVVRTTAAAKRQVVYTGDFSNLIMCNPFEDEDDVSLASFLDDPNSSGYQFKLEADGQINSDGALTALNSLARHAELKATTDVAQICQSPASLPGFNAGASAQENADAASICMMSAIEEPRFFVPGDVSYVPAEPHVVTTSLNTAFDMWDYPISEVLEWNNTPGHPLQASSPLFQPDIDILKGRVWDEGRFIDNQALLGSDFPASSRLNYVASPQAADLDLMLLPCLATPAGSSSSSSCYSTTTGELRDFIAVPPTANGSADPYLEEYYVNTFALRLSADFVNPVSTQNLLSFYDIYLEERVNYTHAPAAFTSLTTFTTVDEGSSLASFETPDPRPTDSISIDPSDVNALREDGSLYVNVGGVVPGVQQVSKRIDYDETGSGEPIDAAGALDGDNNPVADGFYDLVDASSNYQVASDNLISDQQRRRMNVTMLNCGESFAETNDGVTEYKAPVAGFAAMFLLQPTRPKCGDGSEFGCTNPFLASTEVFVEFIEEADSEPEAFAVLVR